MKTLVHQIFEGNSEDQLTIFLDFILTLNSATL